MSDRHAALLLVTVHLPQLLVPGSGTVFLEMSRLPHLLLTFRRKLKAHLFRLSYPDIIL